MVFCKFKDTDETVKKQPLVTFKISDLSNMENHRTGAKRAILDTSALKSVQSVKSTQLGIAVLVKPAKWRNCPYPVYSLSSEYFSADSIAVRFFYNSTCSKRNITRLAFL